MSKPATKISTAPKGRVLRGNDPRVVSGHAVLSDTLDTALAAKQAPKSAAEQLLLERTQAIQQGYNDGLAKAREEVEFAMDDANKRVHRALAALCEAVDAFDNRETIALVDVEDAIVASALAIASAILQREIECAKDPGADAIARALKLTPYRGEVIARLNPDDVATLSMESVSTTTQTVRVMADPSIETGGCVIDAGSTRIDAQISSALDNVRVALRLTPDLPIEQVVPSRMTGKGTKQGAIAGSDATSSRTTASEAPSA